MPALHLCASCSLLRCWHAVQVTVGLILIANIFSSIGTLLEVLAEEAAKHSRRLSDHAAKHVRGLSGQQSPGQHGRLEVIGHEDGVNEAADGNRVTPRPVP